MTTRSRFSTAKRAVEERAGLRGSMTESTHPGWRLRGAEGIGIMDSPIEKAELAIRSSSTARVVEPRSWAESHTWRYTLGGGLLGLGAPAGALALRVLGGARLFADLGENAFFYLYALVGTCLVFSVVGFLAGRRADPARHGHGCPAGLWRHQRPQ